MPLTVADHQVMSTASAAACMAEGARRGARKPRGGQHWRRTAARPCEAQVVLRTNGTSAPTLAPAAGQHRFQFRGTKAPSPAQSPDPSNTYLVAPPGVSYSYCHLCLLIAGKRMGA